VKNIEKTLVLGQVEILPLLNAFASFKRAMEEVKTELERDGAVQRFEYTFELAWKVLKKILAVKGLDINNPRDVFRDAARMGLIDNLEIWFEFIKMRNLTVHTYNEDYAVEIFQSLPKFQGEVEKLIEKIKKL
jgi:nucleotidyltransferase substrate binding protein (TIGR01987 family)